MTPERLKLENDLITTFIYYPQHFQRWAKALPPEFFSSPNYRKIVRSMHNLFNDGIEISHENVANDMGASPVYDDSSSAVISALDLGRAVRRLTEMVILEKGVTLAHGLSEADDPYDVINAINQMSNEYASILASQTRVPKSVVLARWIEKMEANRDGKILRIPTGFPTLDSWSHGGSKVGNLTFLGGAPAAGKTSFMLQWGTNTAGRGYGVTFIEGEMPEEEILSRIAGQITGLPVHEIENGRHMDRAVEVAETINSIQYELQTSFERNVVTLLSSIKEAIHGGSKLVMVDYLQVFVDKSGRANDEFAKIKALSEGIRKLALINGVHILAASSLNRLEVGSPKITLNSFYGGSQLGHDCNTAIILTNQNADPIPTEEVRTVIVNVVKNRGGRTGDFKIAYTLESQRMVEQSEMPAHAPPRYAETGDNEEDPF